MAESAGTDGSYCAGGMPAIIRSPDTDGASEREFIASFTAGLLFARKFHLDVAWLKNSILERFVAEPESGFYRLLLKDHIGIVCRLPFDQMRVELEENRAALQLLTRKVGSGRGRVWNWPTGKPLVVPRPLSADGEWVVPVRAPRSGSFVARVGDDHAGVDVVTLFRSVAGVEDLVAPDRFWSALKAVGNQNAVGRYGIHGAQTDATPMDEALCHVASEDLKECLSRQEVDNVLGSFQDVATERDDLCKEMCVALMSPKCVDAEELISLLRTSTLQIAKRLNLNVGHAVSARSVRVSIRHAMMFLLSWETVTAGRV